MAEVKTYYGDEPSDQTPGTRWLRTDGTSAQRDLSLAWVEKGTWTLEDDDLLSKEGGEVRGPVTGNHGHAPIASPAFTGTITVDGEEVPDKPWVTEQLTTLQSDLQNFITEALSGGGSGSNIGYNLAFGYGTVTAESIVPLPKYSDDTTATISEVILLLGSFRRGPDVGTVDEINAKIDSTTLKAHIDEDEEANGTLSYIIVCKRS